MRAGEPGKRAGPRVSLCRKAHTTCHPANKAGTGRDRNSQISWHIRSSPTETRHKAAGPDPGRRHPGRGKSILSACMPHAASGLMGSPRPVAMAPSRTASGAPANCIAFASRGRPNSLARTCLIGQLQQVLKIERNARPHRGSAPAPIPHLRATASLYSSSNPQ
jgi:hypothetical protein